MQKSDWETRSTAKIAGVECSLMSRPKTRRLASTWADEQRPRKINQRKMPSVLDLAIIKRTKQKRTGCLDWISSKTCTQPRETGLGLKPDCLAYEQQTPTSVRIQAGKWNLVLRRPKCNGKNQLGLKTSQAKEELGRKKEKTICSLACGGDEISNQQSVGRLRHGGRGPKTKSSRTRTSCWSKTGSKPMEKQNKEPDWEIENEECTKRESSNKAPRSGDMRRENPTAHTTCKN
jgi:hypothetical protein